MRIDRFRARERARERALLQAQQLREVWNANAGGRSWASSPIDRNSPGLGGILPTDVITPDTAASAVAGQEHITVAGSDVTVAAGGGPLVASVEVGGMTARRGFDTAGGLLAGGGSLVDIPVDRSGVLALSIEAEWAAYSGCDTVTVQQRRDGAVVTSRPFDLGPARSRHFDGTTVLDMEWEAGDTLRVVLANGSPTSQTIVSWTASVSLLVLDPLPVEPLAAGDTTDDGVFAIVGGGGFAPTFVSGSTASTAGPGDISSSTGEPRTWFAMIRNPTRWRYFTGNVPARQYFTFASREMVGANGWDVLAKAPSSSFAAPGTFDGHTLGAGSAWVDGGAVLLARTVDAAATSLPHPVAIDDPGPYSPDDGSSLTSLAAGTAYFRVHNGSIAAVKSWMYRVAPDETVEVTLHSDHPGAKWVTYRDVGWARGPGSIIGGGAGFSQAGPGDVVLTYTNTSSNTVFPWILAVEVHPDSGV